MWLSLRKRSLPLMGSIKFSKKGENGHFNRDCIENSCSGQATALTMKIYGVCLALNTPRFRVGLCILTTG